MTQTQTQNTYARIQKRMPPSSCGPKPVTQTQAQSVRVSIQKLTPSSRGLCSSSLPDTYEMVSSFSAIALATSVVRRTNKNTFKIHRLLLLCRATDTIRYTESRLWDVSLKGAVAGLNLVLTWPRAANSKHCLPHPSSNHCHTWLRHRSRKTVSLRTVFRWCSNDSKFVTDNSNVRFLL